MLNRRTKQKRTDVATNLIYLLRFVDVSVDLVDLLSDGVTNESVPLIIFSHQFVQTLPGVPRDQVQE